MEQTATPGGPGLPCSHRQALALYQHLFGCPAGLGQLQAALRQVQESRACRSGLELPAVLLEMERSRRAQEQLLWDLELLTGAGLRLFWPPWAQCCGLRDQAQCAWSQRGQPHGRTGRGPEQLTTWSSRLCPLARAGDSLSQNRQLPEGGQAVDPSSAPDLDEARSDRDPRWKSPATPAGPTCGCLQELNPTTGSSFGDLGGSEFKDLAQREERRQAAPTTQRPSTSLWGRKLAQGAPRPSGLPSQGLSEPHDPPEGLSWSLGQERAELQKLLRLGIPQRQREEAPQEQKERPGVQRGEVRRGESKEVPKRPTEKIQQGQRGEATQALREEVSVDPRGQAPEGERRESPQRQRGNSPEGQRKEVLREPRKETPQGREGKSPQTSPGCLSQAWEVPQGEAPPQPPAEGGSLGISGDFCRPLGEQMPQPGGRESPGSGERTTQLPQDETDGQSRASAPAAGEQRAARQGARPPLPRPRLPAGPPLPGPGAEPLAAPGTGRSGQREQPAALPGRPGLVREPHGLQDPEGSPGPAEQVPGGSARLPGTVGARRGGAEAPEAPKAAWPGLPGGEQASAGVSAAQQETALQRLLELHRAARRRRRQDREQQRLRVLERLRLARNRQCRVHPLGPPPSPAQLPPQASLPGEGGGAAAILPGRGRGASRVPSEREPRAAARTPKEGGGARLPGCCPLPAPSGPRGGRPGPQRCARPRRTRRGGGAPCGSSCSEGSGRGPGGCGPSGPGTPRTSSCYCGPPALRSLRLERRAHPSRPPPVLAESSKARLQRRGLRKSKLATRRPASAEQRPLNSAPPTTTASPLSSQRMTSTLSLAEKADLVQMESLPTNTISLPLSVPPASPVRFQHLELPGYSSFQKFCRSVSMLSCRDMVAREGAVPGLPQLRGKQQQAESFRQQGAATDSHLATKPHLTQGQGSTCHAFSRPHMP